MNLAPMNLEMHEYPEQFEYVASLIGDNAACSLLWYLPGFQVRSIPMREQDKLIHEAVRAEWVGTNTASLAVRHGISYKEVEQIVAKDRNIERFDPRCNYYLSAVSDHCGEDVSELLVRHFAGNPIHIPRYGYYKILRKLILRDHQGDNTVELAAAYGVSVQWVYKILGKEYQERVKRSIQTTMDL